MGCAVSCTRQTMMALFSRQAASDAEARAKLERKLYLAKESPEPEFDLSDCQLRKVPSGIYSICKVFRKENLYLNNNTLHSLEDGGQLSDLYVIKILNISSNKFVELPNDIRFLVNMTELYLQNNFIKFIPECVEHLKNLQILDVSTNKLRMLTPALGKLQCLRKLNIRENKELNVLCRELCFAGNLALIDLDSEQFVFPGPDITSQGTSEIMKFLCNEQDIEYIPPLPLESQVSSANFPNSVFDPFARRNTISWEEQEAAVIEQENKIHEAAKQQRDKFLTSVLQEQVMLDNEIAKVHGAREIERQKLIKTVQDDEREIEYLVKNFIQSDNLKPEIVQQQLAHEQAEHDRLLEITRQNYDNIRKADVLKAMETVILEDYSIQHSKKYYEDSLNNVKQSMLLEELECTEKLQEFLKAKDQSRTVLVDQLLEDQDIQKAVVASLVERVDARSWSLNEEISLISSHLARLSVIEQEKKKLQVAYNYNELLEQRVQLVYLLDDLLNQQTKRRKQLVNTLKEMESEKDYSTDFWLKNYQKLLDSTPKTLLNFGKHLDPVFANYLLQEGVIHCLPFLVKFLFSDKPLLSINSEDLRDNGVTLSSDRDSIMRAIKLYVGITSQDISLDLPQKVTEDPTASLAEDLQQNTFTGVVSIEKTQNSMESECVICMDGKCEVVFVPCGHMCCCVQCATSEVQSCPMCRSDIERKIKVVVP